jgi:hypothetical protein
MNIELMERLIGSPLWSEGLVPYLNERLSGHVSRLIAQEDPDLRGRIKELQAIAQLPELVQRKKNEGGGVDNRKQTG